MAASTRSMKPAWRGRELHRDRAAWSNQVRNQRDCVQPVASTASETRPPSIPAWTSSVLGLSAVDLLPPSHDLRPSGMRPFPHWGPSLVLLLIAAGIAWIGAFAVGQPVGSSRPPSGLAADRSLQRAQAGPSAAAERDAPEREPATSGDSNEVATQLAPGADGDAAAALGPGVNLAVARQNLFDVSQYFWSKMAKAESTEEYSHAWLAATKCSAAAVKMALGQYEYLPSLSARKPGASESKDQTFFSVADGVGMLVFEFHRGADDVVFQVVDAFAVAQQSEWDAQVAKFNALSSEERSAKLRAHAAAAKEARALTEDIILEKVDRAAGLERLTEIRRNTLPTFMEFRRGSNVAGARTSIGR